jgi:hypothetical protein
MEFSAGNQLCGVCVGITFCNQVPFIPTTACFVSSILTDTVSSFYRDVQIWACQLVHLIIIKSSIIYFWYAIIRFG